MGASAWDYVAKYSADPQEVLDELHARELAEQQYYWSNGAVPKPATMQELWDLYGDEENEDLSTEGTHSILDVFRFAPPGTPDEYAQIVELSAAEVTQLFGTDWPTRAQFDEAVQRDSNGMFDYPRWSGRFTTLFEDGQPAGVAVWGYSGD